MNTTKDMNRVLLDKFYGLIVGHYLSGAETNLLELLSASIDTPEGIQDIAAYNILYYKDYTSLLLSSYDSYQNLGKLWASIMDATVHGARKKQIVSADTYENIELDAEEWLVFEPTYISDWIMERETASDLPTDLQCVALAIKIFREHHNFELGFSSAKVWGSKVLCLYAQLAGAYYGLTDIDENHILTLAEELRDRIGSVQLQ